MIFTILIETLKFYDLGDYNKNVHSDLEGQQFNNKVRLGFFIEIPFKSERANCDRYSNEGNVPIQINSQIFKLLFCNFVGSFRIRDIICFIILYFLLKTNELFSSSII